MKKLFTLMLAVGLISFSALANRTVKGKVVYAADGEPLIGATVQPVGAGNGTATDLNGDFTLSVGDNVKLLTVSYVGLQPAQVAAEDGVVIKLNDAGGVNLDEVVVTAMGIKREKKALGYDAQALNADELNTAGSNSLASAIQGKLTGVDIRQSSGAPGASSQIVIRGARSFDGNNSPLYVVDGMPISAEIDMNVNPDGVTGADISSRSIDINPEDIESIDVLKGQAASALYGIRASNGVIVITTKRGKLNSEKPVITLSTNISAERVSRKFKRQNVYAQGNYFVDNGDGTVTGYNPASSMSWGPKITDLPNDTKYGGTATGAAPGKYYNPKYELGGLDGWQTPTVYDNVGQFFQGAFTENANLNIAQKRENVNYSFGISNSYQKGLIPSTGMTRWGARGLVDLNINKEWKTGFSFNYSSTKITAAPGANSGIMNVVYSAPSEYNLKGIPSSLPSDPSKQILFRTASFNNPYWWAKNNEFLRHTNRAFGNAYVEYHPKINWGDRFDLYFREQAGIDFYTNDNSDRSEMYTDAYTGYSFSGEIENYGVSKNVFNNLFTINFDAKFGAEREWDLTVLLGNEINHENGRIWDNYGSSFNYFGFPTFSNALVQTGTEYKYKDRTVGFFGQATLSWANQVYLSVTGREDIVSSMPHGNRSFFYPSVSASWIFTELEGLKHNSVLSFGKLRASFAQVGQAGTYRDPFYYTPSYGGGMYTYTPISFPVAGVSSFTPYYIQYDPNLKPQNTNNFETGVDLGFFNNRLTVNYTMSYQRIVDQIFDIPTAGSVGYQYLRTNGGKMTTWSHELSLNGAILQNKDYQLDLGINFTRVWNYVNELAPGVESIMLGGFVEPQVRAQAGCTYPNIYGTAFKRDADGNLLLLDGLPQGTAGSENLGNCSPDFNMGFNLSGRYKRVSLSTTWDWQKGGRMYHGTLLTLNYFGATKESLPYHEGTIVADGIDEATGLRNTIEVPAQDYWQAYNDVTEAGIYSTSYFKLRDLTLTYQLPRLGNFDISVYGFARNVLLWAKMPNFDPESSQGVGNMSGYFERFSVPNTSSFGAGFKVQF